ncbi:lysozyme inhibitor LprI family protein [Paeniclostridium sordellii]|uniref:lysozyme inhibitor LprI family protein n=1 Tax=Paraclostridium sordellii TaxID=1505 RepID=UPI002149C59A|nr:lysozyme inhibitor LprI family protein [Paeniclostridium sordellii]MCR1848895.1 lysozyme inhibitor LprI family protein [Paeniclostridium sordellii]
MKKVIISIGLIMALVLTGCAKDEKKENEKVATVVYCNNCGKESKKVIKFCSNCGKEAKWLAEKPEISKDKKEDTEKKDTEKKDTEKKDTEKKDTEKKDTEKKDTEKKGTEKKGTEKKDTEKKGTTKDVETVKHSYKNEYINKLNSTEEGMSDLDYLYQKGTTGDMGLAEATKLKRWDNMLNEIYSLLKTQLTESEMNELKNKQLSWIEYRDKTAENEASENIGGTLYSVVYNGSLAKLTKERCYELVNTYMK